MTFEEFKKFWMRIGTTHKNRQFSRSLKRPMTGSKGVGRLAVQFLASELKIITVPKDKNDDWLEAEINWEDAIKTRDLNQVKVKYNLNSSGRPLNYGTTIILKGLKHVWDRDFIRNFASEVWWLQPPFGSPLSQNHLKDQFKINFQSTQHDYTKIFDEQMYAIKRIWIARLVGESVNGEVNLSLKFPDGKTINHTYNIADFRHNKGKFDKTKNLNTCRFDIRIYNLRGRQKYGISVGDARNYFSEHGGVHVYDGGFRLPYYGLSESDWLKLEYDHSHRQTRSKLLPEYIQNVPKPLHNLPTLGRVLGVVNVNTSNEHNLKIMITRDRLAANTAYNDLVITVRYAIDWYAIETTKRKIEEKRREGSPESTSLKLNELNKY